MSVNHNPRNTTLAVERRTPEASLLTTIFPIANVAVRNGRELRRATKAQELKHSPRNTKVSKGFGN